MDKETNELLKEISDAKNIIVSKNVVDYEFISKLYNILVED